MVYTFFFYREFSGANTSVGATMQNQQSTEEFHRPTIRQFEKRKVHSSFKDNIWGADLSDMLLINKYNKGYQFLLSVINIFSKYGFVVPLKNKKRISITDTFQKVLNESNLYYRSMKLQLQDSDIEMYSTHNERKSVVVEDLSKT